MMQGAFRKAVVVFYWIALPFALLGCVGWAIGAVANPSAGSSWMFPVGAAAFAGLIGWRLWLNSRALGRAGPVPPMRRLLLVFLPLALLALAGLLVAGTGVMWVALGSWLLLSPEAARGFSDPILELALPIGGGALLILIGAAMAAPLVLRLKSRPAAADSF